jgi:hypothetical protein
MGSSDSDFAMRKVFHQREQIATHCGLNTALDRRSIGLDQVILMAWITSTCFAKIESLGDEIAHLNQRR